MGLLSLNRWYGVNAARVATYLVATEVWDTSVAIPNLQGIKFMPEMDNDEMMIYGAVEHHLSVLKALEITLSFGGMDNASFEAMTGLTSTDSGSGDSEQRTTEHLGGADLGYFGMIAQIKGDGGADLHVLVPRIKLKTRIGLDFAKESKFYIPDVDAKGMRLRKEDGTLYGMYKEIEHAVATTLPTDFNTAFVALS